MLIYAINSHSWILQQNILTSLPFQEGNAKNFVMCDQDELLDFLPIIIFFSLSLKWRQNAQSETIFIFPLLKMVMMIVIIKKWEMKKKFFFKIIIYSMTLSTYLAIKVLLKWLIEILRLHCSIHTSEFWFFWKTLLS